MKPAFPRALVVAFAALAAAALVSGAQAQTAKPAPSPPAQRTAQANQGPPNALQGFSKNKDEPVQIEAASLEVRDKDKVATFNGNVKVVQGDTTMRCKSLVVFYEQQDKTGQPAAQTMKAAQPGPGRGGPRCSATMGGCGGGLQGFPNRCRTGYRSRPPGARGTTRPCPIRSS